MIIAFYYGKFTIVKSYFIKVWRNKNMEKLVSYEKMSKKQQKIVNTSKRGSWGNVNPITKVKISAKVYDRKKKQSYIDYGYSFCGFVVECC